MLQNNEILNRKQKLHFDLKSLNNYQIMSHLKNYYLNKIVIITEENQEIFEKQTNTNTLILSKKTNSNEIADFYYNNDEIKIYDIKIKIGLLDFIKHIGCKIIISETELEEQENLFFENGIICFSKEELSDEEYIRIINFNNFLVIRETDENYSVSSLIRYLIKFFDEYKTSKLFLRNGLKIITTRNISSNHYNTDNIDDFLEFLDVRNIFDNSIVLGIHPYGYSKMIQIKKKSIKKILWMDDLHWFANFVEDRKVAVQKFSEKYDITQMNEIDCLITPSIKYFENLKITKYNNKVKYLFYLLNINYFDIIENDFESRKNKILLSGEINDGYKMRKELKILSEESEKFKKIIEHLEHPGYTNNLHMTELNYYKKLSQYKGAFVGHYNFPLDFPLAKHIEVLMCGCLGFFERNINLEKDLGLIEFVHYIPCTDEQGNLITDEEFYSKWIESDQGKEIAINGKNFTQQKFGTDNTKEYLDFFSTFIS